MYDVSLLWSAQDEQTRVAEMADVAVAPDAENLEVDAARFANGPLVGNAVPARRRVSVRLGDRVSRGQTIATVEDREIQEQVKQAKASYDVSAATIRQREADLRLAQTNLDRSRNLFERQLIPKQTFDDTDSRFQAAVAQLDLARAQFAQAQARLDELKINLSNTNITSPVSGFVGKRSLDPGAWVTPNAPFISVVDIGVVRLVANIVEKDIRRITPGLAAPTAREESGQGANTPPRYRAGRSPRACASGREARSASARASPRLPSRP